MDVDLVCERLATAAAAVPGIVSSRPIVPDSVVVPCFYPGEITESFDETFGGMVVVEIICRVYVTNSEGGQRQLRRFMRRRGSTSVKQYLEADPTLGGACDDLHVRRIQGHRIFRVGEVPYPGAEWLVRVIGTDSQEV
ncbi:hypothetical protein [Micromonospora thermarum]|uniref:Uncharacterized protein n=1 Tax=Micromonospora thermarum TaxID=2720024 RepID=A0ABX0Z761_9ACTN|nr:hypothetical protein [Micromonospora thermarum]NJP33685.1 hypothetical protein [Micromonospora thermarum]